MDRTVITVVGKDGVGIIAKVCNYLASNNVNILDISQTITGGFFNMMMVVDPQKSSKDSATMAEELKQIGEEIGVAIQTQNEKIFDIMHRI
ncbi:ACT domain-containing protein [Anaerostipes sp. MSJ-23]|uniref:ACT domain-containing protein n=1 Tax=unclassified Anaerostipes TaxID=2635253 RepID=UPI001C1064EB|nr:ACT domain-containing protein [Anaerostipes sp. MSJ-23]MBU5460117.1 ACT domain-containing protein [Anaerostipes sp. MSJ-23]